jgi:hypothetical protein
MRSIKSDGDLDDCLVWSVGHHRGDALQVACQVLPHGILDDVRDVGAVGGEPVAGVDVPEEKLQAEVMALALEKRLSPSTRS